MNLKSSAGLTLLRGFNIPTRPATNTFFIVMQEPQQNRIRIKK